MAADFDALVAAMDRCRQLELTVHVRTGHVAPAEERAQFGEDLYSYWNRRMDEIQADDDRQEILGMLARSCIQISPDSADRECGDLVPIHPDMRANLEILVSAGLVRLVETPWVGDKTALKYIATPLGRRRMREAYALLGIPTSAGVR